MNQDEFIFEPSNPISDAFIWCAARESCIDGGIGNSKTTSGFIKLLLLLSSFPRSRAVVFRNTYLDLCKTTRRTFDKVCPRGWVVRDVKEDTGFANGSEIHWLHMDAADEKTLMGLEVNFAFGDQIEEIHPELIDIIDSRLGRWQMPEWEQRCPPYLFGTSNPRGHDSVYFRYHPDIVKYPKIEHFSEWDAMQIENVKQMGIAVDPKQIPPSIACYGDNRAYFFGSTLINLPKLNEIEPTYVRNLLKKPESWKKVWVYGSRDFFEGSIHPAFKESTHVYDHKKFNPRNRCSIRMTIAGFDYGLSSPSCYLTAEISREGYIFIVDEYYAANKTIEQHSSEIHKRKNERQPEAILADPKVFHEDTRDRKVMTKSVAQEYAQYGIGFIRADNNEDTSIQKIEELTQIAPDKINPVTEKMGSPRLLVSDKCRNLIAEIQQQRRKEHRNVLTGEKEFLDERDDAVPDHAYDCLRYIANSQFLTYEPWHGNIRVPKFDSSPRMRRVAKPRDGDVKIGA